MSRSRDLILERQSIETFVKVMYEKYNHDYRHYSISHISRRIKHRLIKDNISTIEELTEKVRTDALYFNKIKYDFSINVTEMFRDPEVFAGIRDRIIPVLQRNETINIWHAGCSAGQEVYSMMIVLKEAGLLEKTKVYGTDFNERVLERAKAGVYSFRDYKKLEANYKVFGGKGDLKEYVDIFDESFVVKDELKQNVHFLKHNLVRDKIIDTMDLIICRNVLIYFDRKLQGNVLCMFRESLCKNGYLVLGTKETVEYTECASNYRLKDNDLKIFQKKN